jgi:hypothetical protein
VATSYNSISRNRRRGRRGDLEAGEKEETVKKSLALCLSRFSIRFRGVSARYTSFNRIRMQCCGKFHLSEARGSERVGWGLRGQARESGSRCDFVSTLRTPSRVLCSPFRHDICISTARLRARSQMQSWHRARHDNRIFLRHCESRYYDSAVLASERN